jgi:hypothetical protein
MEKMQKELERLYNEILDPVRRIVEIELLLEAESNK